MRKAILKTLAYSDIFSFPLKKGEIWRFLIWDKQTRKPLKAKFSKSLRLLLEKRLISQECDFFCLKGKKDLIKRRKGLEEISREKLILAKKFVDKIKFTPWIKAVLITGALAVKNAQKDDDIDIFIIAGKNRLWLTRFLCIFIAGIFGMRRKPNRKKVRNKICFNLFLSEDNLAVSSQKRNLFIAHEIAQARPVFVKGETYNKFLRSNLWVKKYLPNSIKSQVSSASRRIKSQSHNLNLKTKEPYLLSAIYYLVDFLETLAYKLQLNYMRSKKTTEQVSFNSAFFHPQNRGKTILASYTRKIRHLGV